MNLENTDSIESYFNSFYTKPEYINNHPTQGDIYIPSKEFDSSELQQDGSIGIIVISNACDLLNNAIRHVAFVPIFSTEAYFKEIKSDCTLKKWQKLIPQKHPIFFYLPLCKNIIGNQGAIALFQNIRSIERETFVSIYNEPVITLKSPYRDRLSAVISRLFNRVPIEHPEDEEIMSWLDDVSLIKEEYKSAQTEKVKIKEEVDIDIDFFKRQIAEMKKLSDSDCVQICRNKPDNVKNIMDSITEIVEHLNDSN